MEKVSVTCELNAGDVAFLDKLGGMTDRDRSRLIEQAVADFIVLLRWQLEDIDQAIEEADRGDFAADEDVRAAFQGLRE